MSRVFWDTNIFIYLFENHGDLSEQAGELRRKMQLQEKFWSSPPNSMM